jgi:ABC-type Fe3+-hydroxamate transport system substrate-binding protein
MRIVCMVPSWTETLIEAGADVVGRTRFCIHPRGRVKSIAAIGGTKEWDLQKLRALQPDLVVLDQEENTREMGGIADVPLAITHVQGIEDMPGELRKLGAETGLTKLSKYADRFQKILDTPFPPIALESLPSVKEWLHPLRKGQRIDKIIYVIWRNPWMAVSRQTYIGSLLERVVGPGKVLEADVPYPQIEFENLNEESTLLLFSTEPFPFAKQKAELRTLRFASAIVDGEMWSWFGIRSLRFLESFSSL